MSAIEHTSASIITKEAERAPRITVAQLFLRAIQRWQRNRAIDELFASRRQAARRHRHLPQ